MLLSLPPEIILCILDQADEVSSLMFCSTCVIARSLRYRASVISPICMAAMLGYEEVLKYLYTDEKKGLDLFLCAARGGSLEIVKLLIDADCPFHSDVIIVAIRFGHLQVLKTLTISYNQVPNILQQITTAAQYDKLSILKWFLLINPIAIARYSKIAITVAAHHASMSVIKWYYENKYVRPPAIFGAAIISGSVELLDWLYVNESTPLLTIDTFTVATGRENIKILQWLLEHDCPMSEALTSYALEHKKYISLQWLVLNNCPCSAKTILEARVLGLILR